MRIDLENAPRPWWMKLGFSRLKKHLGMIPGPVLVASYQPKFLIKASLDYHLRSMNGSIAWSPTECELLGSYVSKLNTCHF